LMRWPTSWPGGSCARPTTIPLQQPPPGGFFVPAIRSAVHGVAGGRPCRTALVSSTAYLYSSAVSTPSTSDRHFARLDYRLGVRQAEPGPGTPGPRWVEGTLEASQRRDGVLARVVMVARLVAPGGGDAAPELIDAQLLQCGPDGMRLMGVERDPLTRRDTAQAWHYIGPGIDRVHCQLLRTAGAPKPRWLQSEGTWQLGKFGLADEFDTAMQRWLPIARLVGISQDIELVPPLLNARLIQLVNRRIVLTGIDRHPETGVEQAQTWLLMRAGQNPAGAGLLWEFD